MRVIRRMPGRIHGRRAKVMFDLSFRSWEDVGQRQEKECSWQKQQCGQRVEVRNRQLLLGLPEAKGVKAEAGEER